MYRLVRFGALSLEHYNQVDEIGSGETPINFMPLAEGGALDSFGGMQKHPATVERSKTLRLSAVTSAALAALYRNLLALRGTRARLVRRWPDGSEEWQFARLVAVSAQRSYEQARFARIQDLQLKFVSGETTWHGATQGTWYFNDGNYLNDGLVLNDSDALTSFALEPGSNLLALNVGAADDAGRAPVKNMVITVVAGSAPITSLTIQRGGTLYFSAPIAIASQLVIDTGLMRVTLDGSDAYAGLLIAWMSMYGAWLVLEPGSNQVEVLMEGGGSGSTIEFSFTEEWF